MVLGVFEQFTGTRRVAVPKEIRTHTLWIWGGLLVAVLSWAIGGCGVVRPLVSTYGGGLEDRSAYRQIVARWTQSDRLYNQLETIAGMDAFYRSWLVRKSFVEEYAQAMLLPDSEKQEKLKFEREDSERFEDFLLAVYTGKEEWNDLEKNNSIWSLFLTYESSARLQPYRIERYDPDPAVRERFYPFMSPWKKVYRVRFLRPAPAVEGAAAQGYQGPIRLVVTGFLGQMAFSWGGVQQGNLQAGTP